MTPDDRDPTHRYDNGEWEPRMNLHRNLILVLAVCVILLAIVSLMLNAKLHATEYCFAPRTPHAFRTMVRKVIAVRAQCEDWTEAPVTPYWSPGPLTFMTVRAAYITPTLPGYVQLPLTEGEIYRRGCIAWLFRTGRRDFITVSTGIRTSKDDMIADIASEIDLWLRK